MEHLLEMEVHIKAEPTDRTDDFATQSSSIRSSILHSSSSALDLIFNKQKTCLSTLSAINNYHRARTRGGWHP